MTKSLQRISPNHIAVLTFEFLSVLRRVVINTANEDQFVSHGMSIVKLKEFAMYRNVVRVKGQGYLLLTSERSLASSRVRVTPICYAPWLTRNVIPHAPRPRWPATSKTSLVQGRSIIRLSLKLLASVKEDPYTPCNAARFCPEMSLWPKIEYGHIFAYFISRPGKYTQEQLLSWKQLDAYNYFVNGYVRIVLSMTFGSGSGRFCLLKTSQSLPKEC